MACCGVIMLNSKYEIVDTQSIKTTGSNPIRTTITSNRVVVWKVVEDNSTDIAKYYYRLVVPMRLLKFLPLRYMGFTTTSSTNKTFGISALNEKRRESRAPSSP